PRRGLRGRPIDLFRRPARSELRSQPLRQILRSVMAFKRGTLRYGRTPQPITPYQKAAQVWDERLGSARVQARNWRLMAFLSAGLTIGLSGGLVYVAGRGLVVPFVVEIEHSGAVRNIAPVDGSYKPTDAQIAYHLARFIEQIRSLSSDAVIVRQNWLKAYDYVT